MSLRGDGNSVYAAMEDLTEQHLVVEGRVEEQPQLEIYHMFTRIKLSPKTEKMEQRLNCLDNCIFATTENFSHACMGNKMKANTFTRQI